MYVNDLQEQEETTFFFQEDSMLKCPYESCLIICGQKSHLLVDNVVWAKGEVLCEVLSGVDQDDLVMWKEGYQVILII